MWTTDHITCPLGFVIYELTKDQESPSTPWQATEIREGFQGAPSWGGKCNISSKLPAFIANQWVRKGYRSMAVHKIIQKECWRDTNHNMPIRRNHYSFCSFNASRNSSGDFEFSIDRTAPNTYFQVDRSVLQRFQNKQSQRSQISNSNQTALYYPYSQCLV